MGATNHQNIGGLLLLYKHCNHSEMVNSMIIIIDQDITRIWVWINTYENTIFSGLFTSILTQLNFDVNRRGTVGFDPSPHGKPN